MSNEASKITAEAAENLLAVFAGQTITIDQAQAQIETVYAFARKRTGFMSFFNVMDACERAGVVGSYTGPNCTGTALYTFPTN
jgi:hypothetical protein